MLGLEEFEGKAYGWIVGAIVSIAVGFKTVMHMRQDRRLDKAGVRDDHAGDSAQETYQRIVDRLEKEVERMGLQMAVMSKQLNDEMKLRIDAINEANALRNRVAELEREIVHLKLAV